MKNRFDEFDYDNCADTINSYLTPKEVMDLLYIGKNTFYALVQSGALKAFRVGKQWRVTKESLHAYSTGV